MFGVIFVNIFFGVWKKIFLFFQDTNFFARTINKFISSLTIFVVVVVLNFLLAQHTTTTTSFKSNGFYLASCESKNNWRKEWTSERTIYSYKRHLFDKNNDRPRRKWLNLNYFASVDKDQADKALGRFFSSRSLVRSFPSHLIISYYLRMSDLIILHLSLALSFCALLSN